jgi:thiol-disulfide isomerase/thioredoxin
MDADFQLKIELLIPITSWFPREDDFYDLAAAKFMKLQNERDDWILKMAAEHPDAFVTKMLLFQRNPSIPFGLTEESKTRFMQQHYFDRIDWKDPELLRTDLIPLKIINYLTVYSNRNYTQRQLEAAFKEAVDNLLSRPFNDALLKEFVIGYLVKGFEKYGFEEVIVHIAENYQDDAACEHTERKGDLASRLENFKKLAVGKTAPDFVIPGENGHPIHFSDFRSEYLLVIFWATWCPHCTEWLPQIDQLYRTKKNSVEVLTISLDQDEKQWKEYLTEKKFTWYNGCDFKGWNGEMTLDFNIYATPTLIVLDRKRKIISKPMTMDELSILFSGE